MLQLIINQASTLNSQCACATNILRQIVPQSRGCVSKGPVSPGMLGNMDTKPHTLQIDHLDLTSHYVITSNRGHMNFKWLNLLRCPQNPLSLASLFSSHPPCKLNNRLALAAFRQWPLCLCSTARLPQRPARYYFDSCLQRGWYRPASFGIQGTRCPGLDDPLLDH